MSRPATWIVVPRRTSAYSSRLKSPRRRGRRENEPEENSERESGTQEAMYPSFTVRKRDRILDAFSIKSERTRGELGLTRSRLRSTIPDVRHPTARNEITFSHALGNILIRPSPRLHASCPPAAAGRPCETSPPTTRFIFLLSSSSFGPPRSLRASLSLPQCQLRRYTSCRPTMKGFIL